MLKCDRLAVQSAELILTECVCVQIEVRSSFIMDEQKNSRLLFILFHLPFFSFHASSSSSPSPSPLSTHHFVSLLLLSLLRSYTPPSDSTLSSNCSYPFIVFCPLLLLLSLSCFPFHPSFLLFSSFSSFSSCLRVFFPPPPLVLHLLLHPFLFTFPDLNRVCVCVFVRACVGDFIFSRYLGNVPRA